jgi:hypothetical protein
MSETVDASQGNVFVAGGWYGADEARHLATKIWKAAGQAEKQLIRIRQACAQDHAWDEGTNLNEGDQAETRYHCTRDGCGEIRHEPGHKHDEQAQLDALRERLTAAGDQFGLQLLDFDTYPTLIVMGVPMSREHRIDGAALRDSMRGMFDDLMQGLTPPVTVPQTPDPRLFSVTTATNIRTPLTTWSDVKGGRFGSSSFSTPTPAGPPGPWCTHGADCQVHPDVKMVHNLDRAFDAQLLPEDTLQIIGSCWCRHTPVDHHTGGCNLCPCTNSIGNIVKRVNITGLGLS